MSVFKILLVLNLSHYGGGLHQWQVQKMITVTLVA